MEKDFYLANNFSGPVLFDYVWWVLTKASEYKLKKLYFLARDGYTLHKIANLFCERFNLDISCEYLYCSRASLRTPTYFFIGDEALDLILIGGYRITLKSVLLRINLSHEERKSVYYDCGLFEIDENKVLSKKEFKIYADILRNSCRLRSFISSKSREAYKDAIGYLKDMGLFDEKKVAIVDSGWTGSMQRSLRQLMEFEGYRGHFIGFYFGMYSQPKSAADGEYLTWYFSPKEKIMDKIMFCNNLFECLLSAPHGMTVGYCYDDSTYKPILLKPLESFNKKLIECQSNAVCEYTENRLKNISFNCFDKKALYIETKNCIRKYMVNPSQEDAEYYGKFYFCDDITESYHSSLASSYQKEIIKNYSIIRRIFNKISKNSNVQNKEELFWPYGVISFLPSYKKFWWRFNIYMWEYVKYTLKKDKKTICNPTSIEELKRIVSDYDIISFDIFDTLIYRTVNKPTDVFRIMENEVEKHYNIDKFHEKRIRAEQNARQVDKREEVTFNQIYECMDIDKKTADLIKKYEKQVEIHVLKRDEEIYELFTYCLNLGKKVLVISDMYHNSEFLSKILNLLGINGYSALYVSSEENATKSNGKLFIKVAEYENIKNFKKWLHIGDNIYSDYKNPRLLGLYSKVYNNGRALYNDKKNVILFYLKNIVYKLKSTFFNEN